jgi:type VI secretion system protein ImpA
MALAIETLLQPIAGDAPCGPDMSFSTEFDRVQELRREDDASLPQGEFVTDLKVADWQGAAALCEQLLSTRTKDLRVAGWLVEAWAHLRGFAGLADGLDLTEQLCARFWEGVHPLPEAGEHELRAGNLAWLLGRVESLSRAVPVLRAGPRAIGMADIDSARARQQAGARESSEHNNSAEVGALSMDAVARIQRDTPRDFLVANLADAQRSLDALSRLQSTVDRLLGEDGPGFVSARRAVEEAVHCARRVAREAGAIHSDAAPAAASPSTDDDAMTPRAVSATTSLGPSGPPLTRAQALVQLRMVAQFFRATEPHSPVAYLAERAAQWGDMPLHVWLRTVMKDGGSLAHIEELLGVPPQTDPQ